MNMIKNFFGFFFGFKGRTCQSYFALLLPIFIGIQFFMIAVYVVTAQVIRSVQQQNMLYCAVFIFLYFWIKYAYLIKRTHDFNKKLTSSKLANTMLWVDIALLISVLLLQNFALGIPNFVISTICMIALAFIKGTNDENEFGKPQVPFWKKN